MNVSRASSICTRIPVILSLGEVIRNLLDSRGTHPLSDTKLRSSLYRDAFAKGVRAKQRVLQDGRRYPWDAEETAATRTSTGKSLNTDGVPINSSQRETSLNERRCWKRSISASARTNRNSASIPSTIGYAKWNTTILIPRRGEICNWTGSYSIWAQKLSLPGCFASEIRLTISRAIRHVLSPNFLRQNFKITHVVPLCNISSPSAINKLSVKFKISLTFAQKFKKIIRNTSLIISTLRGYTYRTVYYSLSELGKQAQTAKG